MLLKKAAAAVAAASVALGLSLATAPPAAAASGQLVRYGNTNPITSSSSTWRCGGSEAIATNMVAQVCAVRSANGTGVQAAVILRNNASYSRSVNVSVNLLNRTDGTVGNWTCDSAGVSSNSWSVCFGRTLSRTSDHSAWGFANGTDLGSSPFV
ncbi:hypothetical protein LG943_02970 [Streptomonospora sp. S1-112]|uniref:Uncharacterized protein n=1 Tax=Streptomonospora mangrovi TaxID=2883123 RepID=A0A9X3NH05_9ACTN|nr:hypothetical protein [Streptomonospora mangrovi]MDA0563297.1 hypothetical protein [Streptomonospora mangrovi]